MKLGKLLSIMLCACALSVLAVTSVCADTTFGTSVKFDGSAFVSIGGKAAVHDGLVTAKTATITDNFWYDDVTRVTKIVPLKSYSGTNPIGIKHTSVANAQYNLADIKYVRYYYLYNGDYSGRAKLVLPASEFNLTRDCVIYSMEPVEKGRWAYLTFDIQDVIYGYIYNGGILANMQLYPFGDTKPSDLSSADELLLREIYLWGEDNVNTIAALSSRTLVPKYPVSFVPGRIDSEGTAPETVWAEVGEEIILPENTFTREGYNFAGWICSFGSKVMLPGQKYVMTERERVGGPKTATVDFLANWQPVKEEEGITILPSVNRVGYTAFCGGIVDGRKYGSLTRPVMFDGLETVKFTYDVNGKDVSTHQVAFDGWIWDTLPLDLSHYKCLIIPYYYKTLGKKTFTPMMNILGGSGSALSKSYSISSSTGILERNKWDVMVFVFDYETNPTLNKLIQWDYTTVVKHIHFWAFGKGKAYNLVPGDELYLGDFVFLNYVPENLNSLNFSKGFLAGDENGNVRPLDELTNAEASSILAKTNGFAAGTEASYTSTTYTDVKVGDWFLPYVSYLESKGVLPGGGKFNPNEKCAFDDYVEWTVKAASGGVKAEEFGKLPVSESFGNITRSSAVSIVRSLLNGGSFSMSDAESIIGDDVLYPDISKNQWFYPDVVFSSIPTLSHTKNGSSKVIEVYYNKIKQEEPFPEDKLSEGAKYLTQLDKLTNERINEILYSDSEYKVKKGRKTHYVSSSGGGGDTANSSESNPIYVKTLTDVSAIPVLPGDVILFRRGDVFRGTLTANAGVTYSAYGTGDKPKLITSPEDATGADKWELYHSDSTGKKIWKYKNGELADVGAINLISDSGKHLIAYKEIPSYFLETFWTRGKVEIEEFDVIAQLDNDYEFVHLAQYKPGTNYEKLSLSSGVPNTNAVGPIYLRCDDGNPGALYPRIEFNGNHHTIRCNGNSITIDNLCLLYFGRHGVSAGTNHNLTVRNCEIGWGGGSVQSYNNTTGSATRFGNGVEIYGALTNYNIDNCYVYEIYDAGITHQISSSSSGNYFMEGVYYTNNVLVNSTYNIEYFMSINTVADSTGKVPLQERYMKDVYFTDNIVRMAGYGWGVQRPDSAPSNIKGWTHHNLANNYIIEDNIFDRCLDLQNFRTDYNVMLGTTYESSTPYMKNNIFVQTPGRILMTFHKTSYKTDLNSEQLLTRLAGPGNKVYFCPDDEKDYWGNVHWRDLASIRG